jgi:Protein of unknown function (DUF1064)
MSSERDAWTQHVKQLTVKVRVPVNKYHAQRVEVDGIWFDSKKEARRYGELKLLLASGVIYGLEVHPAYPLVVAELIGEWPAHVFETIGEYRPDFRYRLTDTDALVVEDVKCPATKTPLYRLKKKFVEAQYRIVVVEVE